MRPWWPALLAHRDLALVIAMASLASLTISLGMPLLSLVLERHGHGALTIGINTAAGGAAVFVIGPFVGRIVARLGAVRSMITALLAAAAILLVLPLHVDPWTWFGLRLLLGCAGALLFILSESAVNALAPPEHRARVLAAYATAFSLGYAGGPLTLALVGSEGVTPFLVSAAILVASIPPLLLVRGLDRALAGGDGHGSGGPRVAVWRTAPLPFAGVLAYAIIETGFFALLPVWALGRGLGEREAATLLAVWLAGNILLQLPLGWLADRWSRTGVLRACAALSVLLLAAAATGQGGAFLRWPIFLLMGGCMGALYTMSLTVLGDSFGPADLTRANTTYVMTFQVGLLVGPATIGAVMQATSPAALLWCLTVPLVALAAAAPALARPPARPATPTLAPADPRA